MRYSIILITVCLVTLPHSASAQQQPQQVYEQERPPGPFDQGRVRLSVGGGGNFSGGSNYFTIGVGAGYFVIDGLELGLDLDTQFGSGPTVVQLSPGARYFFYMVPYIQPYLGAFYNHWFVVDLPDIDSIGVTGGIAVRTGGMLFIGGGVVYEHYLDCEGDCDDIYPEFFFGFSL